jgi:hypothetical protein
MLQPVVAIIGRQHFKGNASRVLQACTVFQGLNHWHLKCVLLEVIEFFY